eukprot:GABV01003398.1.p1 GENE.GABV01003398.1~~GABV01003398.1.p1  ORF type:complete len:179 (-),score=38.80 GABV01003398.1:29-565(-)
MNENDVCFENGLGETDPPNAMIEAMRSQAFSFTDASSSLSSSTFENTVPSDYDGFFPSLSSHNSEDSSAAPFDDPPHMLVELGAPFEGRRRSVPSQLRARRLEDSLSGSGNFISSDSLGGLASPLTWLDSVSEYAGIYHDVDMPDFFLSELSPSPRQIPLPLDAPEWDQPEPHPSDLP